MSGNQPDLSIRSAPDDDFMSAMLAHRTDTVSMPGHFTELGSIAEERGRAQIFPNHGRQMEEM